MNEAVNVWGNTSARSGASVVISLNGAAVASTKVTSTPSKFGGLAGYDFEITGREPIVIEPNDENIRYLTTKRERMGHLGALDDMAGDA